MANKYKQKIYIANWLGTDNNTQIEQYDKPITVYAFVSNPLNHAKLNEQGISLNYDLKVTLDIGAITSYITAQSVVWIDSLPNIDGDNFTHRITQDPKAVDRTIQLYCKSEDVSSNLLYYSDDNIRILQAKVIYDDDTYLTATIPSNMLLPLTTETKIWHDVPTDITEVMGRIKFVSKELINNNMYRLTFTKGYV